MSTLLWVAVPAGLSAPSTARIRVAVVPRLGDGTLSTFGLQDWPALLANASFSLQIKSGSGVQEAGRSPAYEPTADSEAWHAFFDGDAGIVDEWAPKIQPAPEVRPTYAPARAVVTSYRECASILSVPGADGEAAVARRIAPWRAPLPPSVESEEPRPSFPPATDFHRAVAMLHEHPTVLQALGLVFELTTAVDDLKAGSGPRFLRVRGTDLPVSITSPWTRYSLDDGGFWPEAADSTSGISGGLLNLNGVGLLDWAEGAVPRWALSTLDVDAAVDGLRSAARALDADDGRHPVLPALRTAGLMLIRPDRQSDFTAVAHVAASRAGASLGNAELTAEDLVLGYRVDVRVEDDPDWHPLCERDAVYTVEDAGGRTLTLSDDLEEGHVKPYTAVKTPDGHLYADEVVFRWSGWSPAVPPVDLLGEAPEPEPEPDPARQPPYTFRWSFRPPIGRLPRLRFATRYQIRIRVRDLTGGGPSLADVENRAGATDTVFYTRNEPIQPPRLSSDSAYAAGAAIDQMVIRSDQDMNAAQFHQAHPQYPATEQRTLTPPTVSFALAEQHRVFDPKNPQDVGPQFTEHTWKLALRALQADAADDPAGALPDPAASGISAHIPAAPGGPDTPLTQRIGWQSWPSAAPRGLLLSEPDPAGPPIQLGQEGDTLKAGLAKAEEAVLELSSTVRGEYLDHFCVKSWLLRPPGTAEAPPSPEQWQVYALNGRHPLLSPVRRIHLVHAVRSPLAVPVWQLPAGAVARDEHATYAVLHPTFSPTGLDTNSTGRLEIAATWDEWTNDGKRRRSVDHVHGENVARGDPPTPAIRHELGDTRHREIDYTLKAISRFRTYFDASDPDELFQRSHTQDRVTIPSSARPPDLTVVSTTPAFQWLSEATATRIEHSRTSQRLRVELAGPWYETGEGECLAVLATLDDSPPDVPVTRVARDPLFASASPPPLADPRWFAGFVEQPRASRDLGPSVVLVPYGVTREGDRWYADIEIVQPPPTPSYAPFVRLALARFQADSLPGLSLSPVVVCDPVRLLPDRRLIVERDGPDLHLSLLGTGPEPPNRLEAVLEEAHAPGGTPPGAADLVDVTSPPAAGIPAWRPLSSRVTSDQPETVSTLRMPAGASPLRLRVREIERLDAPSPSASPAELTDRTVFVDIVPLPAEWRPR
ncbi:hypothetical protein [Streptomyces sp. NPDC017958]|uniref:hypothetical protein n=1 Tax=Streptomyces sp. NPDC017958 TaxID=3365021 RepID=UPI0037BC2957